jgi:protein SCO1/2
VQFSEPGRQPTRSFTRRLLLGAFGLALAAGACVALLALVGGGPFGNANQDALRPFGTVPDFALIERSGRQITRDDLLGKVWIADFIFTRCVAECPLISGRMARLQELFAADDDVCLVSITVDPEYDTPEVLRAYAERFGARPQRWWFLTGDKAEIYHLATEGFHLGVVDPNETSQSSAVSPRSRLLRIVQRGLQAIEPAVAFAHHDEQEGDAARQAILHSGHLVLVDRQGRIRQYYDSQDEQLISRIERHVRLLLRER